MTSPLCGPELPPDQPMWSVPVDLAQTEMLMGVTVSKRDLETRAPLCQRCGMPKVQRDKTTCIPCEYWKGLLLPAQPPSPEELREAVALTLIQAIDSGNNLHEGATLVTERHLLPLLARVSEQATRLTTLQLAAATLCNIVALYLATETNPISNELRAERRQELSEQIDAMRRLLGESPDADSAGGAVV